MRDNRAFLILFPLLAITSTFWLILNRITLEAYLPVYIAEFFMLEFMFRIKFKYQILLEIALLGIFAYFLIQPILRIYYGV